jgi:hypothetical protein
MSSILKRYKQGTNERLDRDIDFGEWLAQHADTIASHEIIADAGITVYSSSVVGDVVKVMLTGGSAGVAYKITARVTTTGGRKKEASIVLRVR